MSSTKSRGRPSATQIIETSPLISNITTTINSQTSSLQQQYVPSLLKIESVVPTRLNVNRNHQQRANRLITRSYSTLCAPPSTTTVASTTVNPLALANGTVNYKNVTKKINTNLHRHKNQLGGGQNGGGGGLGHESPTGKINNESSVIVENGIHKIRRTSKEKEKQPDRINLDRRGLCTIPIIDQEPNLRLLSLQHNLINTFHIPDSEHLLNDTTTTTSSAGVAVDGVKDSNNNVPSKDVEKANQATIINKSAKPFLKQKSISRNQLNLNFSANNNANVGVGVGAVKANGGAITPNSFLQKSFMFQSKSGLLKRSNSVMINYSPSQTPTTVQSSIFGATPQRNKLVATPSFSVIDTHTHHEMANVNVTSKATPDIQIDANNSYMNSFRFNLTNLVFLDLYNNQIEKISNLDGLKSLTVLLLGKNRISDISGLTCLKQTLRVLDLHGNRITHITQKISQLQELKSLNLAGNLLRQVQPNDFAGLCSLKELNLKRNRIKKINVSDDLHNLER
jgi:leucine-rich repeat-containing protein 49